MPNPVRIYVLHHPESELAKELTNRIYDWFRLPSREGIPVYVRSLPEAGKEHPAEPFANQGDAVDFLLPLVDDRMVRDPAWHDYMGRLAAKCRAGEPGEPVAKKDGGWVMLPVALDSTAFNLPPAVTRWNFIRHGLGPRGAGGPTPEQAAEEAGETLKHLTEAMARDLNRRLFPQQEETRFKVFISYARADSTEIAKALRNYIQGETQCLAFLDENDIAYGQPFDTALRDHVATSTAKGTRGPKIVHGIARAMIVVNGDSYADRPWCRWEIRRFTEARRLPLDRPGRAGGAPRWIHVYHPLLVVDATRGPAMTRVVPELAQAPLMRWEPGREKLCFSTLMREVLMGLKDVLVARQVMQATRLKHALVVNRLPGPVAIERLLRSESAARAGREMTIHYPGNGLPMIELRLMQQTFEGVRFRAFRDILRDGATRLKRAARRTMEDLLEVAETGAATGDLPLRGKVFAISTAYAERDLAALGYLPQHQDEALIHLVRPLLRLGGDILYGGLPPPAQGPAAGGLATVHRNITATLLQLLADERREDQDPDGEAPKQRPRGPLLFNVPPWPASQQITPRDEAAWINTCRILMVKPADAGLPPWTQPIPTDLDNPPPGYRRYVALTTSAMRSRIAKKFRCRLPNDSQEEFEPAAVIFIGGKVADFSSVMPGIMEEFLHVAEAGKPIYLLGGLGGASRVIARALVAGRRAKRPREFTIEHYLALKPSKKRFDYEALLWELRAAGDPDPQEKFDRLWELIQRHRGGRLDLLFKNGLTHAENVDLIENANTFEAVGLVWKGISQLPELFA